MKKAKPVTGKAAAALITKQNAAMAQREAAKEKFGNGSPEHRAAAQAVDAIITQRTGKAPKPIRFDKPAAAKKPAPGKKPAAKKPAAPGTGKDAALKSAGDLAGPFKLTPAALAAKTPAALRLTEGSARWKLMKYAFAHPGQRFTRDELKKIVGDQLTQALSGCVRYKFLAKA